MIRLLPGASPDTTLKMLATAVNEAVTVSSAGYASDRYNSYVEWASRNGNLLAHYLHADEVDALITSRRYWSLLALDISTIPFGALAQLVDGEVQQRVRALEEAKRRIEADLQLWDNGKAVAVVLDTGAWLKYFDDPMNYDEWREQLDERPHVPLVITIPMKVVDELDGSKRNRVDAPKGGKSIRFRAGLALKYLEAQGVVPGERVKLQEGSTASAPPTQTVYLSVLEQPLDQSPLPDGDLEIIERAGAVAPYVSGIRMITTDYGMVYRAKQAGIAAVRVKGYEEETTQQTAR
jgi:hypothetical protein